MDEIKLAGFQIFNANYFINASDDYYVLPIYSFKCACNSFQYMPKSFQLPNKYEVEMFRPKYLEKFVTLKKEKREMSEWINLIPHITINAKYKSCERCSVKILPNPNGKGSNIFFEKILQFRPNNINTMIVEECLSILVDVDYLEISPYVYHFIIDYWAHANYRWYPNEKRKFNLSFGEVKSITEGVYVTKLLVTLKESTDRFESEVKCALDSMVIGPLVSIVCTYGYSAMDTLGKIIGVVHSDILKYGKIMTESYS
ncbi:MAG: hypothetical protein Hyperionvirus10_43 [Hyperionvirus sp.]|uniref:Uncharacterized protein n=1 Tax=Hyperionvirus sp. TaxID=2487770 RepID=A0A3G5A8X1_9VIRU|nr:MAG: hypothetical protein Hyperionvirus10_43 [Hyperionvirus sp.]